MRVLVACEYSGRTREAFRARGHDVISCDLLEAEDGSPHHIVGDVFEVIKNEGPFNLMIAHPPCTYLANSGVRWLTEPEDRTKFNRERLALMLEGAQFFTDLLTVDIPKVAAENPVMHGHGRHAIDANLERAGHSRYPTHFVQPWWFGDPAFKATGFTLKGLDPLVKPDDALTPPAKGTEEHKAWSAVHRASPSPTRWKDRSRTFPGIANAMAEAWG